MRNLCFVFLLVASLTAGAVAQDPAAVLEDPAAVADQAATEEAAPAAAGDGNAAVVEEQPAVETDAAATEPDPLPAEPAALEPAPEAEEAAPVEPEPAEAADDAPAPPAKADWAGLFARAPKFLALTHHAAVHLPIALWIFGAFFVVVGVVVPSWRTQIPLACLLGGALTSVAAVASGWWYADYEYGEPWAWGDGFGDWSEHLVKHRWLGFALAVASIGLSLLALVSRARESRRLGVVWRLGLILLAVAVAWEGHLGGELIHGEGFLEEAFQEWVSPEPAEE